MNLLKNEKNKGYLIEDIIMNSNELSKDDKTSFIKIKNILIDIDDDLYVLLFNLEFASRISWIRNDSKYTKSEISLLECISRLLISGIITTLFRLWDTGKDVNSLAEICKLINKRKNLKNFITDKLYPYKRITSMEAKRIIHRLPHAKNHILLKTLQNYRNNKIGHNLQTELRHPVNPKDDVYLGNLMILADFTLQLATDLNQIILGYNHNFLKFPIEHKCNLALKEIENILINKNFNKNSSFRKAPFKYIDDSGVSEKLLKSLFEF